MPWIDESLHVTFGPGAAIPPMFEYKNDSRTADVDAATAIYESIENRKLAELITLLFKNGALSKGDIAQLVNDKFRPAAG